MVSSLEDRGRSEGFGYSKQRINLSLGKRMDGYLWVFAGELADWIPPIFRCQSIGNEVNERLNILGEPKQACGTQWLTSPTLPYLLEEGVNVPTGDA